MPRRLFLLVKGGAVCPASFYASKGSGRPQGKLVGAGMPRRLKTSRGKPLPVPNNLVALYGTKWYNNTEYGFVWSDAGIEAFGTINSREG